MRWSRTGAGLTDAGFRGSGDGQRVPRVGTLLATRSATLPGRAAIAGSPAQHDRPAFAALAE